MSADSAISIAWDVLKCLVAPLQREFSYVMSSETYVDDLWDEVQNLKYEAQRVRSAAEVAGNNFHNIHEWVPQFLASAEKALKEAEDLLENFEKASKTCCHGTLPDPNCRYQFSRKAKHETDDIKNLILKHSNREISFGRPAPGNVVQSTTTAASTSSVVFESRALMIRNIMDALADIRSSVVGVHGMGGVGKSTLLADVEKRIREEKLFDWVAKADVSQNPDIERIRGEIARALGLNDIRNEEYVNGRAELLRKRLEDEERQKRKVLIILDNLWEHLDLKSVGIPCEDNNKVIKCKLLLTSRDQHVLRREMLCDNAFLLGGLENEEAERLFKTTVGGNVQDDLEPLVEEALSICAGLPFLILAIAKLFIDTSYSECKDALKQIWNEETGEVINKTLRVSYDRIKREKAKSLLRLCVACGVSKPSLEYLVRYGMGLRLFQEASSMEEARTRLGTLIHTLKASSLLLEDEDGNGFKIHDLVRGFVISIASRDHPLLILKDNNKLLTELSKDKLKSCEAICFPYVNLEELPEELACPKLQIFMLFTKNNSLEVPDSYFNSMRNLIVLNLTGIHLNRSPSPFQFLENLYTLCLDHSSLEDVAILGKLKGLQILSLMNSKIQRLSKEIGQLVELRLLDLNYCSNLLVIEPGALGGLIKLEELYMKGSFIQWNDVDQTPPTNASLIELNNMKNLQTLHLSILDPSVIPEDLNVKKLTKFEIQIGEASHWLSHQGLNTLGLKLDQKSDIFWKGFIQSILDKTNDLFLDGLDGIEQSIHALFQKALPELKHLTIENSPSIHYILHSPSHTDFKILESLFLWNLTNLKKICTNNISFKSFSALKIVRVGYCHKMKVLFPLSNVRELPQLKEMEVDNCKLMQGIVEADEIGKFEMRNMHVLKLYSLPHMKNFFTAKSAPLSSTSDNLVGTQIAFFNGRQVAFQRLETLKIIGLDSLEFIFFPSMVKSLTQLKELTISDCEKMEAIIIEEEELEMETSKNLAFPMLTNLSLKRLKSLTYFSRGKCAQESRSQDRVRSRATSLFNREVAFPNLENLYIKSMDNIKMIWQDPIHADSFSKLKLLSVSECKKLVNVVPSFILGRLLSLETLTANGCDSLEVVFKLQPPNPLDGKSVACSPLKELKLDDLPMLNYVWDKELYRHIKFQCLRLVTLRRCARLTSLFSTSIARDLIQLEELEINQCSIVELIEKEGLSELSINVEAIEGPSHEPKVASSFPSYFQHMKTLDVSLCYGLSNMFTSTIAESLVRLTKLRIRKCEILTEVISDEGGKEGHVVTFNQLKYMELDGLTRLRCFSSNGYTLMFPLLEDIIVNRCPQMKFFHKGQIEMPKLKGVKVGLNEEYEATKYQYFWKGNLNTTIQNMFEEMVTFVGTKYMRLFEFPELIGKWHGKLNPITSSWQLESLVVDKCPSFINAIPSSLMLVLKRMTSLQVRDCESLEEIFDLEGLEAVDCTQVLPWLQYLHLVNLPNLRQLWNRDLQGIMCFNSLHHLSLYKCNNLRHAFVPSMARCLPNLSRIKIKECDQMEGVIAYEEGQGSTMEEITFPKLYEITLECLPNLTSFLSWKNHMLECPNLSMLSIAHCPKMRSLTWQSSMEINNGTPSLFTPQVQCLELWKMVLSHMDNLSKIWSDSPQETLAFDNLMKVQVQNCGSLDNVFPHWVATSLTQLGELQVESCGMEEIVASGNETSHSNTTQDLFPELTSLVLHDMPQLKNFCTNLPTLNWSFLKELRVTHCDKAHSLFERDFPNLERLLLVDNNIQMIQDINFPEDIFGKLEALTLACFHDENAVFPLKFLLERFQNLQSLEVFCSSFEYIFPDEALVDNGKHMVLESLRELKLNKLQNLKSVWREDSLVSKILQGIIAFKVRDCPCLTTIFPTATSFNNLTMLVVKNCSGLVHLITTSMVTNLVHLNCMTIKGCERMKEIVANDGDGEGKVISFENLDELTLKNLPNLECFSSMPSCIFKFPSLWRIEVKECLKMKTFSKGTLSTPKLLQFIYEFGGNWENDDDLNTIIQKLAA